MKRNKPKARIAITSRGWCGYLGHNKVKEFGSAIPASELDAKAWFRDQVSPVQNYGYAIHPETKEPAPEGEMWVRSIFGNWLTHSNRTPYTCSPASETYWSS